MRISIKPITWASLAFLFVAVFILVPISKGHPFESNGWDCNVNYFLTLEYEKEWFWCTSACGAPSIGVGDLDGDGIDEIVQGGFYGPLGGQYLGIWKYGGGQYSLIAENITSGAKNPYILTLKVDDIDDDGTIEIITAGEATNLTVPYTSDLQLQVWNFTQNIMHLEATIEHGKNITADDICIGDVDNDSEKEIVVVGDYCEPGGKLFGLLQIWNYSNSKINLEAEGDKTFLDSHALSTVELYDLDNDDISEIVTNGIVIGTTDSTLNILNYTNGSLNLEKQEKIFGYVIGTLSLGDVGNDDITEIVCTGKRAELTYLWIWQYLNDTIALEGFTKWGTPPDDVGVGDVLLYDIDRDSDVEILTFCGVCNSSSPPSQIYIWRFSNEDIELEYNIGWDIGITCTTGYASIGDTDGDKEMEIVNIGTVEYGCFYLDLRVWGVRILPNKPPTAVALNVTDNTANSLNLSWSKNSDIDFASYKLFRNFSSSIDENAQLIAVLTDRNQTSYVDAGLAQDTEYFYRIYVVDTGGLTNGSNVASGRTLNQAPTSVVLSPPINITETSLTLSWSQNKDSDFARYEIYMATKPDLSDAVLLISINSNDTTSYTVEGLSEGKTYYFMIRVWDTGGLYGESNIVHGTTKLWQERPQSQIFSFSCFAILLAIGISVTAIGILRDRKLKKKKPKENGFHPQ